MKDKTIILPKKDGYPLDPSDLFLKRQAIITRYTELDWHLSEMMRCAAQNGTFVLKRTLFNEGLSEFQSAQNHFFKSGNCKNWNRRLEDDFQLIHRTDDAIFLTHELISSVVSNSGKIGLEHIEFDEIPRKTVFERTNPERFADVKSLVLHAQKEGSLGPFSPEQFPKAGDLKHFVKTTEEGFTILPTLLDIFFRNYPSPKCVKALTEVQQPE